MGDKNHHFLQAESDANFGWSSDETIVIPDIAIIVAFYLAARPAIGPVPQATLYPYHCDHTRCFHACVIGVREDFANYKAERQKQQEPVEAKILSAILSSSATPYRQAAHGHPLC